MIATITALVVRLAAIRWAFKTILGLGVLVPAALLLKVIGLPILAVLGILAMPVLFVLFLFGLPVFLVLIVGAMLMAGLSLLLAFGLAAVKFLVFVVLPVWLVWKLAGFLWRLARPAKAEPVATQVS
jgi:hypothetical protein